MSQNEQGHWGSGVQFNLGAQKFGPALLGLVPSFHKKREEYCISLYFTSVLKVIKIFNSKIFFLVFSTLTMAVDVIRKVQKNLSFSLSLSLVQGPVLHVVHVLSVFPPPSVFQRVFFSHSQRIVTLTVWRTFVVYWTLLWLQTIRINMLSTWPFIRT